MNDDEMYLEINKLNSKIQQVFLMIEAMTCQMETLADRLVSIESRTIGRGCFGDIKANSKMVLT